MILPTLTFLDLSLLFLGVAAIILLIPAVLTSPPTGLTNLIINRKKLSKVALTIGMVFLIAVAIKMIDMIY